MSFGRFARLRPFAIERFLMLRGFILAVHVLLALMIIGLVLLQRGKGAEAGAGFGSGASGTVFGARGTSTLFSKLTAVFAGAVLCHQFEPGLPGHARRHCADFGVGTCCSSRDHRAARNHRTAASRTAASAAPAPPRPRQPHL